MHKRMLLVSRGLKAARGARGAGKEGIAEDLLYKAQCNDAYWHGIFGGLYLPHLRAEIYKNIIEAEGLIPVKGKVPAAAISIEKTDLDADGRDEVIVRTRDLNLFITPEDGGALVELDYKPGAVNLLNTLSRWPEAYHHKLRKLGAGRKAGGGRGGGSIHDRMHAKGAGLDKYLKIDYRRRATLRDHFLPMDAALGAFSANEHEELGGFPGARYEAGVEPNALVLSASGIVNGAPVSVRKEIRPRGANSFSVDYHVGPGAGKKTGAKCLFGVEFNLILPCSDGSVCSYRFSPASSAPKSLGLGGSGRSFGVNKVSLIDKLSDLSVTIEIDTPATLWRFPIHTVSLSETGFEKIYQGSCLLFLLPFNPDAAGALDFRFMISVERFSQKRGRRLSKKKSIN
jgi:alpha-amylase